MTVGGTTSYDYLVYQDGGGMPWLEITASGGLAATNSNNLPIVTDRYLNAESVDLVLADDQTNPSSNRVDQTPDTNFGPVWLLTDQVGTARDLVYYSASAGSWLVTHRVFNSFGALEQNVITTASNGVAVGTSIAYAGALLDPNTGLQDSWNRWYNPGVGQFISPDPDGLAAGTNPYAYCDDCPLDETDPTGDQQGYAGSGLVFAAGYNQAAISLTESCPSAGTGGLDLSPGWLTETPSPYGPPLLPSPSSNAAGDGGAVGPADASGLSPYGPPLLRPSATPSSFRPPGLLYY